MTIYAVQISPESQESPIFIDGLFPEGIILTGNRDYNSHTTPEYKAIIDNFDGMANDWENARAYYTYEYGKPVRHPVKPEFTIAELLRDWGFERPDGKPWTTMQRHKWRLLMESEYQDCTDDEIMLPALELLTGHKWTTGTIRGNCQSDWQDVIYQAETWNRDRLNKFETEYFNTGSEWQVKVCEDGDDEPDLCLDDFCGTGVYCTSWSDEGIAAEIAAAMGGKQEDVIMYKYVGYTKQPKYERVGGENA